MVRGGTLKLHHSDFRPLRFLGEGWGMPDLMEWEVWNQTCNWIGVLIVPWLFIWSPAYSLSPGNWEPNSCGCTSAGWVPRIEGDLEKTPLDSFSGMPSLTPPIIVSFKEVLWDQTRPGILTWVYQASWPLWSCFYIFIYLFSFYIFKEMLKIVSSL